MIAMILAVGLGTRLKSLTDHKSKALVQLNGTTLLEHALKKLTQACISTCFINEHHYADLVIDFLKSNNNFGVNDSKYIFIDAEKPETLGLAKVWLKNQ